jgi:hypothetical protein
VVAIIFVDHFRLEAGQIFGYGLLSASLLAVFYPTFWLG